MTEEFCCFKEITSGIFFKLLNYYYVYRYRYLLFSRIFLVSGNRPDIRNVKSGFFYIQYPAKYLICLAGYLALLGRISSKANQVSRISGLIDEMTISIHKIFKDVLKLFLLWCKKCRKRKPSIHLMSLFMSYFTWRQWWFENPAGYSVSSLHLISCIRPDIRKNQYLVHP
jgi:hypothetical protein